MGRVEHAVQDLSKTYCPSSKPPPFATFVVILLNSSDPFSCFPVIRDATLDLENPHWNNLGLWYRQQMLIVCSRVSVNTPGLDLVNIAQREDSATSFYPVFIS